MMTTILSNLNQKLAQLEAGNLTQDEMELLVEDAKELYERLVILRYKIYETNVLGPRKVETPTFAMPTEQESTEETVEAPSFDLFEMGTEEPIEEISTEIIMDFIPEAPLAAVETDLFVDFPEEEEEEEEPVQIAEEEIHSPIVEENLTEESEEEEEEEEAMESEIPNEAAIEETSPIVEEEVAIEAFESNDVPAAAPQDDSINSAWILQIEQTIRADRSVFPLETLIGSFSLNEKLQFINELFDGSSDAFSSATKKLDACASMSEARTIMTEYSSNYEWDLDSEIVEDFIFKICRRYA